MQPGQLDRKISIQRQVVAETEYGQQPFDEWVDVYPRIWAQVQENLPSKSESTQGGLKIAAQGARLRTHYLRRVTSDMRVVVHDEQDRIFQISSPPAMIGRREWTELAIEEYSS